MNELHPTINPGSAAGLILLVGGITFVTNWGVHSVINMATKRRRDRQAARRLEAIKAEIVEAAIAAAADWNRPAAWTSTTGPVEPPVVRRVQRDHRAKAGAR